MKFLAGFLVFVAGAFFVSVDAHAMGRYDKKFGGSVSYVGVGVATQGYVGAEVTYRAHPQAAVNVGGGYGVLDGNLAEVKIGKKNNAYASVGVEYFFLPEAQVTPVVGVGYWLDWTKDASFKDQAHHAYVWFGMDWEVNEGVNVGVNVNVNRRVVGPTDNNFYVYPSVTVGYFM